jgi:hypothetical protein
MKPTKTLRNVMSMNIINYIRRHREEYKYIFNSDV